MSIIAAAPDARDEISSHAATEFRLRRDLVAARRLPEATLLFARNRIGA